MSSALTCQDALSAGGHQQPWDSTPRPADVSMDTSFWSGGPEDNTPACQDELPAHREGLSILTYDPVWNDQLSPHLQRNRQLQDTLLQREEELARLQEENNTLKEFFNSSFVKDLEEKVKRLNAEGRGRLKRSIDSLGTFQNLTSSQPVLPGPLRRVTKRVCRTLNFDFGSEEELTAAASEPSCLDQWVLKILGLKDRDTIDTSFPSSSSSSSSAAEYPSSSSGYSHGSSFDPPVTPGHAAVRSTSSSSSSTAEYSLNTTPCYPAASTPVRTPLCASSPAENHLNSASYNDTITSLSHIALSSSSSSEYSLHAASYDHTSPTAVRNGDNYCQAASHQAAYGYGAPVVDAACRDVDVELSGGRGDPAFGNSVELSGSRGDPTFGNSVEPSGIRGNPTFGNSVELSGGRGDPTFGNSIEPSGSRGDPTFGNSVEPSGSHGDPVFGNSVRNYSGSAGQCSHSTGSGSVVPHAPDDTMTSSYNPVTWDRSPPTQMTPSPKTTLFSAMLSKEMARFASPGRIPYTQTPDASQSTPVFISSPVQSNHGGPGVHFAPGHHHHHHCHSGPPGGSAVGVPPHTPSPSTGRSRTDVAFSMSLSPSSSVRTHSFPQGQAFVRKDTGGGWNFTWVPT